MSAEHYPGMSHRFRRSDGDVRRAERKRIRLALREAFKEVKSLTPGDGRPGSDVWVDAARNMYQAVLRIVRR